MEGHEQGCLVGPSAGEGERLRGRAGIGVVKAAEDKIARIAAGGGFDPGVSAPKRPEQRRRRGPSRGARSERLRPRAAEDLSSRATEWPRTKSG